MVLAFTSSHRPVLPLRTVVVYLQYRCTCNLKIGRRNKILLDVHRSWLQIYSTFDLGLTFFMLFEFFLLLSDERKLRNVAKDSEAFSMNFTPCLNAFTLTVILTCILYPTFVDIQ